MSYGPSIPMARDSADGFRSIKQVRELVKQNLTNLILTMPGERVFQPNYGVGVRQYLFENFSSATYATIEQRIREQTNRYMPGVSINSVNFTESEKDNHILIMQINYSVPSIGLVSSLAIGQSSLGSVELIEGGIF